MELCKDCGNPLDETGFTNCNRPTPCGQDRAVFAAQVEEAKEALRLPAIASMEKNGMPACFTPTRASLVAMAGLLMEALRQNQTMADLLKQMRSEGGDKIH